MTFFGDFLVTYEIYILKNTVGLVRFELAL